MTERKQKCPITGTTFECAKCPVPSWHKDEKCGYMVGDDFIDRIQEDIHKFLEIKEQQMLGGKR